MESLAAFEDTLFDEYDRRTHSDIEHKGNVSLVYPKWFMNVQPTAQMKKEQLDKFKYQYYYHDGKHHQVINCYQILQENNGDNISRDIHELAVHSYLEIDSQDEAEQLASTLFQNSQNYEQLTNACLLLSKVYAVTKSYSKQVQMMKRLILGHPLNPMFWWELCQSYMLCGEQKCNALICAVRARLLFYPEYQTAVGFMKDKIAMHTNKITQFLETLDYTEDIIQKCVQFAAKSIPGLPTTSHVIPSLTDQQSFTLMHTLSDTELDIRFTEDWLNWDPDE